MLRTPLELLRKVGESPYGLISICQQKSRLIAQNMRKGLATLLQVQKGLEVNFQVQ